MKSTQHEAAEQMLEAVRRATEPNGVEVFTSISAQERITRLKERLQGIQQNACPIQHATALAESAERGDVVGIVENGVKGAMASLEQVLKAIEGDTSKHSFSELFPQQQPTAPSLDVSRTTDAIPDIDMLNRKP